jgi:hypothetical protein
VVPGMCFLGFCNLEVLLTTAQLFASVHAAVGETSLNSRMMLRWMDRNARYHKRAPTRKERKYVT